MICVAKSWLKPKKKKDIYIYILSLRNKQLPLVNNCKVNLGKELWLSTSEYI